MQSFRNDPDGAANREATQQSRREIFALRMQAEREVEARDAEANTPSPTDDYVDHVPHPYHDGTLSVD